MSYQFPPDVQQLIRQRMAEGSYSTEDDLLRDALRALESERQVVEADAEVVEGVRRGHGNGRAADASQGERRFSSPRPR